MRLVNNPGQSLLRDSRAPALVAIEKASCELPSGLTLSRTRIGVYGTSGVRKTYRYRLDPTPQQQSNVGHVLWRCRTLYNVALQQRKLWWERGHGIGQLLPTIRPSCPISKPLAGVWRDSRPCAQNVILRLDRAFQAFFRRIKAGETPGYPRFQGRGATTVLPSPSMAMARSWMKARSL